ncbi:hypothetical protein SAMN02745208_02847 [Heyndrickxia coagulans DSM 1 = ATCC 7050]|uniref:Uncharacterized protein n=1 Tax=Heyndrickxia coagulans DSM 1 = ATCC 7050 TaxID=1121088 RepID=A0A8B4BYA4_HEYCO|nr:hypothetical protein SAMN02745208_02847 [Heyndrickxia coagulans DSM 1 = ATCC 7050]
MIKAQKEFDVSFCPVFKEQSLLFLHNSDFYIISSIKCVVNTFLSAMPHVKQRHLLIYQDSKSMSTVFVYFYSIFFSLWRESGFSLLPLCFVADFSSAAGHDCQFSCEIKCLDWHHPFQIRFIFSVMVRKEEMNGNVFIICVYFFAIGP